MVDALLDFSEAQGILDSFHENFFCGANLALPADTQVTTQGALVDMITNLVDVYIRYLRVCPDLNNLGCLVCSK